jgi:hypothetical protein
MKNKLFIVPDLGNGNCPYFGAPILRKFILFFLKNKEKVIKKYTGLLT